MSAWISLSLLFGIPDRQTEWLDVHALVFLLVLLASSSYLLFFSFLSWILYYVSSTYRSGSSLSAFLDIYSVCVALPYFIHLKQSHSEIQRLIHHLYITFLGSPRPCLRRLFALLTLLHPLSHFPSYQFLYLLAYI